MEYVDYGNHESLPLERIRALDSQFSAFPRQAMVCKLAGIEFAPVCLGAQDHCADKEWSLQVLRWLHTLIAEKPIDIIVYHWSERNRVEVDVCVPLEAILSDEAFATLPTFIPVDNVRTYTREKSCSRLSLLSIMQSFGLVTTPLSGDEIPGESFQHLAKGDYLTKQFCEPLSPSSHALNLASDESCSSGVIRERGGHALPNNSALLSGTLPPLLICLEDSGKFTAAVSYVIDPWNFYVRPIQEFNAGDDHNSLPDYISKCCSQPVNFGEYFIGGLCCVQSVQVGEWYRGIVTDVNEGEGVIQCQVHHLDRGNSQWYMANQVKVLPDELHQYPAQAVHCVLSNVHPHANDDAWKKDTVAQFKRLTKDTHFAAFIKSEGKSMEIFISFEGYLMYRL